MPSEPLLRGSRTTTLLDSIHGDGNSTRAWQGYRDLVLGLAGQMNSPRVLEIGGGRAPLLTQEEVAALGGTYTVNDIDGRELALAPGWTTRLHGDIADPSVLGGGGAAGSFDFAFSRMVFEHVRDPAQAYANIAALLRPGGILVNFIPTLYATPFIVNKVLPERLAARMLRAVFPQRNNDETPKFPAYYRWCTSTPRTEDRICSVGFSHVTLVPFYGHSYYRKFPVLAALQSRVQEVAAERQWRALSAFAFVVCER